MTTFQGYTVFHDMAMSQFAQSLFHLLDAWTKTCPRLKTVLQLYLCITLLLFSQKQNCGVKGPGAQPFDFSYFKSWLGLREAG